MDYALANLVVTIILLVATFAFRKRILKALGRLLLRGAIEFAQGTFVEEEVSEAADGTKMRKWGLSARGRAILDGIAPAVVAWGVDWARKSFKLDLASGVPGVGTPTFGQAFGIMLSGPIKRILPREAKPFAGQIGMAIGERVAPMLEGFAAQGVNPSQKKEEELRRPVG